MLTSIPKKVSLVIVVTLIFGTVLFFFYFYMQSSILINYIPKESQFWLWQDKNNLSNKSALVLQILGVTDGGRRTLKSSAGQIVLYTSDGQWFQLTAKNLSWRGKIKENRSKIWLKLQKEKPNILGFLSLEYLKQQFSQFGNMPIFLDSSYFFLKEKLSPSEPKMVKGLQFAFLKPETMSTAGLMESKVSNQIQNIPKETILIVKLEDKQLLASVADVIKTNVIQAVSQKYPVIVEKTLPDNTLMQERKIEPELLKWEETTSGNGQLVWKQDKIQQLQVANQLPQKNFDFFYRLIDNQLVFNRDKSLTASPFDISQFDNFVFLNLEMADSKDIMSFADMLGKSEALSWLKNLKVKKIFVGESEKGVGGELEF